MQTTRLKAARTHNLQGVSLDLSEGALVCVTGVSGAGKSSLAMDTLYAEGQRRFVESFSPYARQFLERLERPPMEGLDPVAAGIAVDRRGPVKSSRSTVATLADVEAYLSALFTREAVPVCPDCGVEAQLTQARATAELRAPTLEGDAAVVTFASRVEGTLQFLEVRGRLLAQGYRKVMVDGAVVPLESLHASRAVDAAGLLQAVVDRMKLPASASRLGEALERAWDLGGGVASLWQGGRPTLIRRGLCCPTCARAFEPARPGLFSYQTPVGACAPCKGFGRTLGIDWEKVIPAPDKSLEDGAIRPWSGASTTWERGMLERFCKSRRIAMDVPWSALPAAQREAVLEGEGGYDGSRVYPGVRAWFRWMEGRTYKMHVRVLLARYREYTLCSGCQGARLNSTSLSYRVGGLNLAVWHGLELQDARARLAELRTTSAQGDIARKELLSRFEYLERVGLGYLSLDRQARTLSGGEAQRVSLTAALGTSLTGALFVLDEPTVGLHPADVPPLTEAMAELAQRGNIALIIEHDPQVILAAHRVVELGPGAGSAGGRICFDGPPELLAQRSDLPTGRLLGGVREPPRTPRQSRDALVVEGVRAHNLRDLSVRLPLGVLCVITGPSGSGKSTLMGDVVYRSLARRLGVKDVPLPTGVGRVTAPDFVRSIVSVDQSPLGRTSRGNAATYTKAWELFRQRLAAEPEAVLRDFTQAHFSFNVALGRCEACSGEGYETVEMQFLADVALQCPACLGRRFKPEVLAIRVRGLSVAEILDLTIDEALKAFADDAPVVNALSALAEVGLGYLRLGQPLSKLSGGEAQRVKLARALGEEVEGTLFLLDEPSAGLHDADVAQVMAALHRLVDGGASVMVVDHDLAVMRGADWIVDLGPGGGRHGGLLVAQGPPSEVMKGSGATAKALAEDAARAAQALRPRKPASKNQRREVPRPSSIHVEHAREHNLQDVSCQIPLGKLTVVTGPSGSGKSTLAFDVVFAEGQRRFLETLTPYARQFLPTLPRPDVERIANVPPSIALEQRTTRAGGTSTVATVTEVAHYLRLLYAKLGAPHCPRDGSPITAVDPELLLARLRTLPGARTLLAPAVRSRKGTYLELFSLAAKRGLTSAWVDGELVSTDSPPKLAKAKEHDIDLVVQHGPMKALTRAAFHSALSWGKGALKVRSGREEVLYSTERACPLCNDAIPEMDPRWFSFNTRQGRCERCEGVGLQGGPEAFAEGLTRLCAACGGSRLAPLPRAVKLEGLAYHETVQASVAGALARVRSWRFTGDREAIGVPIQGEILRRLEFLARVGLGYLSLDRAASTLSGGEMQRLRLSAQLGAGLTGALYVLDEPTVGLHPRDTGLLLDNLRALVKTGSTVLVVEHDTDTIRAADHLIDMGPTGGRGGGRIIAEGTPREVLAMEESPTAQALALPAGEGRALREPAARWLELKGARAHNLKRVNLELPLERLTVVAGVSGSGKSTLIRQVLYPAARRALGLVAAEPLAFTSLKGHEPLRRVLAVDQSPIGRTSRSVPATFLGIWDELRRVFAALPEAKSRGYTAARFSFNTGAGGRCQTCAGQGELRHEMSFLPDATTACEACRGLRFEPATLEVRYRGLSAGDVLNLSADEAREIFSAFPKIAAPLSCLSELGVGYLRLGQGSNTLSGGEAQRLKLAAELTASVGHEPTLYVLDEPTTGLHVGDVSKLIRFLQRLVNRGDTLVVIEHHPAVMAAADHLVELGPEGGDAGGSIVAQGTPRAVAGFQTATGEVLRQLFKNAG